MTLAYAAVGPETKDTWETPAPLFDALDRLFRFTLDVAADESNRKLRRWLEGPCRLNQTLADLARSEPALIGQASEAIHGDDPVEGLYHATALLCACVCGLCSDWMEEVVWCNPPYGKEIGAWVRKFAAASLRGATVVALLPNGTDTEWFADVWRTASEVWFLSGRVQFVGSTSSNPKGSIVAVFRPEPTKDIRDAPHVRLWDWRSE